MTQKMSIQGDNQYGVNDHFVGVKSSGRRVPESSDVRRRMAILVLLSLFADVSILRALGSPEREIDIGGCY